MSGNPLKQASFAIIAFSILVGFVFCEGCSKPAPKPWVTVRHFSRDTLNDLVMDNLRHGRIVMLGDGYHQHGFYMRMVTDALNYWLDELEQKPHRTLAEPKPEKHFELKVKGLPQYFADKEKEKSNPSNLVPERKRDTAFSALPKKLILFLEADSDHINSIYRYMQTGDASAYLARIMYGENKWGHNPGFYSVDNFEFLQDLKHIQERVQGLNTNDPSHSYDFMILGAESVPPYDREYSRDTSVQRQMNKELERKKFEYFAHERDKRSSSTIYKMLKVHPDYKAVVFYGTGHLLRGERDKAIGSGPVPDGVSNARDYFLVHFLDEYFSRDSVADFFTREGGMNEGRVEELEYGEMPDYEVFSQLIPPNPSPAEIIPCRATLGAVAALMKGEYAANTGDSLIFAHFLGHRLSFQFRRSYLFNRPGTRAMIDSLWRYAGDTNDRSHRKEFETADALISQFDAVENIDSLQNWIAAVHRDTILYLEMLREVLTNLPYRDSANGEMRFYDAHLDKETREFLLRHSDEIKQYFLVNLLWIATPDEQSRAMKRLTALTGQKFQSAKAWSEWWRNTKYNRDVAGG